MWEAFLSILEMKLRFEIERTLLRSSVDRDGSVDRWKEAGQELVWMTIKKILQKERDWQGLWGLDQGSKFEGFWWRIVLMGFQGARIGIYDLWVSRVCKDWYMIHGFPARIGIWFSYKIGKKDSALKMRYLTELHSARNFMRSKGDFQRRQHRSSQLRYSLAQQTTGLIHGQ